ncbi:MAG: hypothetical protein PHQ19_04650 [Candidatus Krumholzibacteria bacterium]|nr:hypothetical protein [Candidatus Krumholzibacteria bacterium]
MTLFRLIAAAIAGWILWGWLSRRFGGDADGRGAMSSGGGRDETYGELTDQPIEDAEYEDISRK